MSLMAMKAQSESMSAEKKRTEERRRNILVLIHQHLIENGYVEAAERLQHEAGTVLGKFEVADNVDMTLVLSEYEQYYEMRFDRKPKLTRKLKDGEENTRPAGVGGRPPRQPESSSSSRTASGKNVRQGSNGKLPTVTGASSSSSSASGGDHDDTSSSNGNGNGNGMAGLGVSGVGVGGSSVDTLPAAAAGKGGRTDAADRFEERVLKPPPQFAGDPEMRTLAAVISREIYQESPNVRFDDIVQLDEAKRLLSEAVQLPLQYPSLFTGLLRPWKGILLHGPPGTGKTLLAKAVATECHTTFFNISASTLVSKWRGDSEKLVRALFEVARYHAPSTIFLDEMDSILTSRGAEGGEHEASRRMKTELLIQMDGVRSSSSGSGSKGGSEQVFVMAASNLPWDLDVAVLRRLEKRVLVPLPGAEARQSMVAKHLAGRTSGDVTYADVAAQTEGYSGADIELVCREAAMIPVRRLVAKLNSLPEPGPKAAGKGAGGAHHPFPMRPQYGQHAVAPAADVDALLKADPITATDVRAALLTTKPSSDSSCMDKYIAWQNEFGSV